MWFWALDERRKWRERWRAEAYTVGYAEGYAQGRAHLLNRMWTTAQAEGYQELAAQVERIAREARYLS